MPTDPSQAVKMSAENVVRAIRGQGGVATPFEEAVAIFCSAESAARKAVLLEAAAWHEGRAAIARKSIHGLRQLTHQFSANHFRALAQEKAAQGAKG